MPGPAVGQLMEQGRIVCLWGYEPVHGRYGAQVLPGHVCRLARNDPGIAPLDDLLARCDRLHVPCLQDLDTVALGEAEDLVVTYQRSLPDYPDRDPIPVIIGQTFRLLKRSEDPGPGGLLAPPHMAAHLFDLVVGLPSEYGLTAGAG